MAWSSTFLDLSVAPEGQEKGHTKAYFSHFFFHSLTPWFGQESNSKILNPLVTWSHVRHLDTKFGVGSAYSAKLGACGVGFIEDFWEHLPKKWFLGHHIEWCHSFLDISGSEKFSLVTRHNRAKFDQDLKSGSRLKPPKYCSPFY